MNTMICIVPKDFFGCLLMNSDDDKCNNLHVSLLFGPV